MTNGRRERGNWIDVGKVISTFPQRPDASRKPPLKHPASPPLVRGADHGERQPKKGPVDRKIDREFREETLMPRRGTSAVKTAPQSSGMK